MAGLWPPCDLLGCGADGSDESIAEAGLQAFVPGPCGDEFVLGEAVKLDS